MAKLMIVDDDREILNFFATVLQSAGHEVLTEPKASRAIFTLMDYHPDLVITDIFMPDMDGYELISKIRGASNEVKILAISAGAKGFSKEQTLMAAKDFGANDVLEKPFQHQQILNAINNMLAA